MSVNPSPIRRAFVCPLCGEPIDAMTPEETKNAPAPADWEPNLSVAPQVNAANFVIAQNMAANEVLIWSHYTSMHTMREAVLALGAARNALMEIRDTTQGWAEYEVELKDTIADGLGHK